MGFYEKEELFVTGRLKDLIIIRGRNHYPQDIELTAEKSVSALRDNCSAAFSIEVEGEERLVVVSELKRAALRKANIDQIIKEIQIAISLEHEVEVYGIVLLKTATMPKTSSGKVQRSVCKQRFLEGNLNIVGQWQQTLSKDSEEYVAPSTPTQEIIANIFSQVLSIDRVGIYDNFFELEGHSLLATQLVSRLQQALSIDIPLRTVFESPRVIELESSIALLKTESEGLSLPAITPRGLETESIPLSFAQERLWFLGQLEEESLTYNIPAAVRMSGELNSNALRDALTEIGRRHEVLRTSFLTVDGKPTQVIDPANTIDYEVVLSQ